MKTKKENLMQKPPKEKELDWVLRNLTMVQAQEGRYACRDYDRDYKCPNSETCEFCRGFMKGLERAREIVRELKT